MYKKNIIIKNKNGLHIRPLVQFVKKAKGFKSEITVTYNSITVDAKSLFKLQTLGLVSGSEFTITACGQDEKQAIASLLKLVSEIK